MSTKHCFTATFSADFQQPKLIPSWGKTEQPGSTYYLQKLSHDLFGIVDHSIDDSAMYIFDEHIRPKNTDHTLACDALLAKASRTASMDLTTSDLS